MLGVLLVSLLIIPAIAERTIVIDKVADVKEEFLFDVISDVKNYRQIFPEYVQSIQLVQNDLGNVADIVGSAKGFGYNIQIAYESEPSIGKFSQAVVKGDYSGSRMTTTLTKTYGFDGTPEGGTKIHTELKMKSSGWFSVLSFVSDEQIKFGVEGAFDKLIQRAKDMESGKISTTVTPSNTPIIPESPVTTQPPVTEPTETIPESPVIIQPPVTEPTETIPESIVVTTDKSSYVDGETILVTGKVMDILVSDEGAEFPVSLRIEAPNGNLVSVAQIDVGSDKKFSAELTAGGALMRSEGTYTIAVLYGTESRTAETTFTFGGSTATPGGGTKIKVEGTDFTVNYKITGGKLVSITPDVDAHSLRIAITANQDGSLEITLPRALIDAKMGDQDDTFFVLVDGEEVDFEETTTSTDRTLTIQFPAGAEEIEIIGTFVVPEFGTIAVMILAVAIISIIAVSAKSRLSIMPRY